VEIDFVITAQFEVLQARAVAQGVVGEVEDVIGLVIGEMQFEHVQLVVDGLDEADASRQQVDGADATVGDAAVTLADLVTNIRGSEGGFVEVLEFGLVEPKPNPALASLQLSSYLGVHSKLLFRRSEKVLPLDQTSRKSQEFRVFSTFSPRRTLTRSLV